MPILNRRDLMGLIASLFSRHIGVSVNKSFGSFLNHLSSQGSFKGCFTRGVSIDDLFTLTPIWLEAEMQLAPSGLYYSR